MLSACREGLPLDIAVSTDRVPLITRPGTTIMARRCRIFCQASPLRHHTLADPAIPENSQCSLLVARMRGPVQDQ